MEIVKFTIPDNKGRPVPFTIKVDVPRDTIRAAMDEVIHIFKAKGYMAGEFAWRRKLAALVIVEPEEYCGQEDKVGRLPFGISSSLYDKIDQWYPFWDIVPSNSRGVLLKLKDEWHKSMRDWLNERNERSVREEEDIMLRETDTWEDLDEIDRLLSSILEHASKMSSEFVIISRSPDRDMSKVVKTLDHMATLKLEVERAQMILRRLGRYRKDVNASA